MNVAMLNIYSSDLVLYFQNTLILPTLTPQTAVLRIFDFASNKLTITFYLYLSYTSINPEKRNS